MIDLKPDANPTTNEWLVTNGIGGYASGTVGGVLTRRYHGLLVAALKPPLGRTVLVSKLDEVAQIGDDTYELSMQWWQGQAAPSGESHLVRFYLDGTTPVWEYAFGDARLEKRVWMQHQANTTYVLYTLLKGEIDLHTKVMINHTDFHVNTHAREREHMHIEPVENGLKVNAYLDAMPFYLLSSGAEVEPQHIWYHKYFLEREQFRGLDARNDHLHGATFHQSLRIGESMTLVFSTNPTPEPNSSVSYQQRTAREKSLVAKSQISDAPDWVKHLVLAADQFIVQRRAGDDPDGRSIIAGYHWFGDWGRDTMISLPGLTLTTGRTEEAAKILQTYAHHVDQGMIPNRFPDSGNAPEYNTVDATLWYINAVQAYYDVTNDDSLLQALFPVLQSIIQAHETGTRYNIHVDDADGLLYSGAAGVQLTWMDAKIGDWVVTPRTGKAVEINALWYNALMSMAAFAMVLGEDAEPYRAQAQRTRESFGRFWNGAYLLDVIDTPDGDDATMRPNQIFAASLKHSPLNDEQKRAVIATCEQHLLTPLGLRSLAPDHEAYSGTYGGDRYARDSVYHQGPVWLWLIGHFVTAHYKAYGDAEAARAYLQPFAGHLREYCVGSLAEIAEGDAPHTPRAAIAQAWSVAEVLRAWALTAS